MATIAAWVLLPFALLIAAGGAGLLVEALSRAKLPNGLLAPLGVWALVLIALPCYLAGLGATVPALLAIAVALAGYAVGRRELLRPVRTPAALAALLAYLLYLGPVLATGGWTWTGYNFVNDPAVNLVMVEQLARVGDRVADGPLSTANALIEGAIGGTYPIGVHGLLATLSRIVPAPLLAAYQPFVACLGAVAAMALTELARRCRLPSAAAVGAALLAVGAGLAYNYALHGAIKEIAVIGCLATAAAAGRVALDAGLHPGTTALIAVPAAAALAIISAVAAAYALALALALLIAALAERRGVEPRALARAALAGGAALLVLSLPFLRDTISYGQAAGDEYGAGTDNAASELGQLLRPLPLYQALGVWLRDDYRYPLEPGALKTATIVGLVLAGALVAVAVASELRSRRWGASLLLAPALAVALATALLLSPYGQAKMLVILSPMAVFAAALGAWRLVERLPAAGWAAAALLGAGVLGTDAMAYHSAPLAPVARIEALDDALARADGGRWLLGEWEEYAKLLGFDVDLVVAPEGYTGRPGLRTDGRTLHRSLDLDAFTLAYVDGFDGIVVRRSPTASRPPAAFRRVYANEYYELWRRAGDAPQVLEHMPLGGSSRGAVPDCAEVTALAGRLGPGERLVAAPAPASPGLDVTRRSLWPRFWGPAVERDTLIPKGEGRMRGAVKFAGGRYQVWVRGSAARPLRVSVDERLVGEALGVNTPGQFLAVATVELTPGYHTVELRRPGGSVRPGDGHPGSIGRVVFEPVGERELVTVTAGDAERLCGQAWDWIERVR